MLDGIWGQLFGRGAAEAAQHLGSENPELQQSLHVLGRVQQHLHGKWLHLQRSRIACSIHLRHPARGLLRCTEPMIGPCMICERPVCLEHAAVVIESADAVCLGCIEAARQHRAAAPRGNNSAPHAAVDEDEEEEEQYLKKRRFLRRLKLRGTPTEAEINAAFRREAAKTHPDQAVGKQKKATAHKRFVLLGEARDWLIKNLHRKAA